MIRDRLISALQSAFPSIPFKLGQPPEPIAIFAAKHPEVGEVRIFDDGDEATVLISEITHSHFNPYDQGLSQQQVDERVTEDVIDFLQALFSDHVLLSRSPDRRTGGWQRLHPEGDAPDRRKGHEYFVWSGPAQ